MNQIVLKMKSKRLMQKSEICVLLPEVPMGRYPNEYFTVGRKYPVLWLLHGGTCDFDDYLQNEHIANMLQGHEVMVVMPNGLNSDFANHMEFGTGYAFADFFFEELMPYIYKTFPASSEQEDNYLTGFSMGGAAALMYGLYQPEKFGRIAVLGSTVREAAFLEPYQNLSGEQFRKLAMENPTGFPTEFGNPECGITLKEINMIARYGTVRDYLGSMECTWNRFMELAEKRKLPQMLFCCGDQDMCCEKVQAFKKYADTVDSGKVTYVFLPGYGHDRADVTLRESIRYFQL